MPGMSDDEIRVIGIVGSLRAASRNRALLRAAVELAPRGVTVVPYDIRDLPFYDSDLEEAEEPASVLAFKQAIAAADGVLFVTPEYNYDTSGVLKNAIDWANRGPKGTRGPRYSPMALKPVFVMGAASTFAGSARAQTAVREAMIEPGALLYNYPQVLVATAHDKVDAEVNLTDELTRDFVALAMQSFAGWIRLVGERSGSPHREALAKLHVMDPRRQSVPGGIPTEGERTGG